MFQCIGLHSLLAAAAASKHQQALLSSNELRQARIRALAAQHKHDTAMKPQPNGRMPGSKIAW